MVTMRNKNIATAAVAVTDAGGNAVAYALNNLGNRIGKKIKNPPDVLQCISRSFDALNRVQQVTRASR
jgi:hypothetical protein